MASCSFVVDIIITQIEAFNCKIDDIEKLKVEVNFNGIKIPIHPDCINASDFQSFYATQFNAPTKKLRKNLGECGMVVTVEYNKQALGTGQIRFPEKVLDNIAEDMNDMVYSDACNFDKAGIIEGRLEILCRLVIKCDETPKLEGECDLQKCIKPEDIMFIIADSQKVPKICEPCLDVIDAMEGDQQLELDLNRYESLKSNSLRSDQVLTHDPVGDSITKELKKMTKECTDFMEKLLKSTGQSKPLISPDRRVDELSLFDDANSSSVVDPTVPTFSYLPTYETKSNPNRSCPVCLNSMSWLPKFAACPHCGIKPMPVITDRQKKSTSDNILYSSKSNTNNDQESSGCRCMCKYGKICSYCRVLNICADFYKPAKEPRPISSESSSESLDYGALKTKISEPHRPFLSRVFSELRCMHDIKDTAIPSPVEKHSKKGPQRSQNDAATSVEKNSNRGSLSQRSQNDAEVPLEKQKQSFSAKSQNEAEENNSYLAVDHPPEQKVPVHHQKAKRKGAVSRQHGWNWPSSKEASKHGWRPGCVTKPIKRIMKFFLENSQEKKILDSDQRSDPILNMCKKNGEILVTLRTINSLSAKRGKIVFKIVKSDLAKAVTDIKRSLKIQGFRKCTCHQTVMMCLCRENVEKAQLTTALETECQRYGIESCVNDMVFSETSDSDMEYDINVSPPAGRTQPSGRLKLQSLNNSTQTNKADLKMPTTYPVKLSPYARTYDCAAGDRYTGTALGKSGETLVEDGMLINRGGGRRGSVAVGNDKTKKSNNSSDPIPVRLTKRLRQNKVKAAEAKKEAAKNSELANKNKKDSKKKGSMQKGRKNKT